MPTLPRGASTVTISSPNRSTMRLRRASLSSFASRRRRSTLVARALDAVSLSPESVMRKKYCSKLAHDPTSMNSQPLA